MTVTEKQKFMQRMKKSSQRFRELLLKRMVRDCNFFLGKGDRYYLFGEEKDFGKRVDYYLWGYTVPDHIEYMKMCYKMVKPTWLTMADILNYEKEMSA